MKYKVLKNLKHNGVVYTPGTEVVLPEKDTSKLLTEGVLEQVQEVKEAPKEPKEEPKETPEPKKPRRRRKN